MTISHGKVAVLMGGTSAEREISLRSGQSVLAALLAQNIDAFAFDPAEQSLTALLESNIDKAFIVMHGRGGEDGTIQGLLELAGIPYTGTGVLGSALAMDKHRSKQIWRGMGLPTPPAHVLNADTDWQSVVDKIGLPLIVKPASEGSSVGMSLVHSADQLAAAWRTAAKYDAMVFAEAWVQGKEYTAAFLDQQILPMIRLQTPREFYDYTAKYQSNDTQYHCPCGLSAAVEQNLHAVISQAYQALGVEAWGRVDFMIDDLGEMWLLEVNTVPGMTDHSLVPMAAHAVGIDFNALVLRILELACLQNATRGQTV